MSTDNTPESGLHSLLEKAGEYARGFGMRILIHICAILLAGAASSSFVHPDAPLLSGGIVFFCAYVGLVCLLPRGMSARPEWIVPSAMGGLQLLVWAAFGVPWQFLFLWSGALTWTIRALARRGDLGWEWVALPCLLIGLICFFSDLRPLSPVTPPYWTFPLLAAAGWGLLRLWSRNREARERQRALPDLCTALEKLASSNRLSSGLNDQVRQLAAQTRQLLAADPTAQDDAGLRESLRDMRDALAGVKAEVSTVAIAGLLARAVHLNQQLQDRLQALERKKRLSSRLLDPALLARLQGYRSQAQALLQKTAALSPQGRGHVQGIVRATENILSCMSEDARDVGPGDKFLSRYLNAAHTVLDEHARLSTRAAQDREIKEALEKSAALLERLEQAFNAEHTALLANDTVNFNAELNVLDKLLKMDGR